MRTLMKMTLGDWSAITKVCRPKLCKILHVRPTRSHGHNRWSSVSGHRTFQTLFPCPWTGFFICPLSYVLIHGGEMNPLSGSRRSHAHLIFFAHHLYYSEDMLQGLQKRSGFRLKYYILLLLRSCFLGCHGDALMTCLSVSVLQIWNTLHI